jgi:hypothetical protein
MKAALDAAATIKGLLEMMFEVVSEWIAGFIADIEAEDGSGTPAPAARSITSSRRASSAGGHGRTCLLSSV